MTLRDELPPRKESVFTRIDHSAHDAIKSDVERFLASGGTIEIVPYGATANEECRPILRNEFTGEASLKETQTRLNSGKSGSRSGREKKKPKEPVIFDGENRSTRRSKYGENIRKKEKGEFYYVNIFAKDYYKSENLSIEDAKLRRDELRVKLKVRPAIY